MNRSDVSSGLLVFVGGMMLLSFATAIGFSASLAPALALIAAFVVVFATTFIASGRRSMVAVLSTVVFVLIMMLLDQTALGLLSNYLQVEALKFSVYAVALVPVAVATSLVLHDLAQSRQSRRDVILPLLAITLGGCAWVSAFLIGRFAPGHGLSGVFVGETLAWSSLLYYPLLLLVSTLVSAMLTRLAPRWSEPAL